MGETHAERIMALLAQSPELNDDEIAEKLCIKPRQTVNQICRRLEQRGALERRVGAAGKIVNVLASAGPVAAAKPPPSSQPARKLASGEEKVLVPERFDRTLLIMPCSKGKRNGGVAANSGPCLADKIAPELAAELISARKNAAMKTSLDEAALMPAWQRYSGSLYRAGAGAVAHLLKEKMHIIILSGGYGAVLAGEPIGNYDQPLKTSWWPGKLLQRVLLSYASVQGIRTVRAFASSTSPYSSVLRGIRWDEAGIEDALLVTPEAKPGGTHKSPASIGEAVAALAARNLRSDWKSSYGLGLEFDG
ncbi:hypothetical protein H0I76_07670 [Limibaculum sp. M0105]|uniref:Uncharacterized protein n=1 Tax=Thermohalobaculum xanthum TaxID=2753746 RepID=A0A8J7M789_9RHOB|nr:hypothetical protein [Thermohalobaculum xanthum]MBK0399063.1 hypothetical protein [Thermohalobaculum xanthum]